LPVAAKIAFLQGVTTVPTTGSSIRRALSRLGGSPEAGQALDHPSRSPIRAKKTVRAEVASD
jgi:hypothetical protein